MQNDKLNDYILKTRKLGKYKDTNIIHEKALDVIAENQADKHEREYIQLMKYVHFREMLPLNLVGIAICLYILSLLLKIAILLFKL